MNRDMPSAGKVTTVNQYKVAHLRREITRMKHLLTIHTGPRKLLLRFRIKWHMIDLKHELKQLK